MRAQAITFIPKLNMRTTRILLVPVFCFGILFAQTQTETIKKTAACDYELIADSSLLNTSKRLLGHSYSGLTKKEANMLRKKLHFLAGTQLFMHKDSLFLKSEIYCEIKNKRLVSVKIKSAEATVDGKTYYRNQVMIHLTYAKKKTKGLQACK